jgi:hypothetical protein
VCERAAEQREYGKQGKFPHGLLLMMFNCFTEREAGLLVEGVNFGAENR